MSTFSDLYEKENKLFKATFYSKTEWSEIFIIGYLGFVSNNSVFHV